MPVLVRAVLGLVLLALCSTPATARELYWKSLEVEARLDEAGLLHIQERQNIVFTGDWNGGERTFRLFAGQKVRVHSLRRVDPATGKEFELVKGDLSQVDHYDWTDSRTLRWRSRLPSAPVFDATQMTYVLEYTLSGTLERLQGKTFRMAPNFVFPDRVGPIEEYALRFQVDPIWESLDPVPAFLERRNLRPGQSVVVSLDLRYTGDGWPKAVLKAPPWWLLVLLFACSLGAIVVFVLNLRNHETHAGRFQPSENPRALDRTWLEENLFGFAPEEAGALWDRKVGPPEVAAVLARLVASGKIESEVKPKTWFMGQDVLHLKKKVHTAAFESYDRLLVAKLFYGSRDETDTESIRKHYRKKRTGLDPATVIRPSLERRLEEKLRKELGQAKKPPAPTARRTGILFLAAMASFVLATILRNETNFVLGAVALIPTFPLYVIGRVQAAAWSQRVDWRGGASLRFFVPAALIFLVALGAALMGRLIAPVPAGIFGELALALLPVIAVSSFTNAAKTRDAPKVVQVRKRLAAARRLLALELAKEQPDLEDDWFPYFLAFGLQGEVDRWFKAFGGATGSGLGAASAGSYSSVGSGSSSSSWTGGGGSFGGAGATATWAAAATGIASGVSAPSSSGSGGSSSGGGGGGSSGGGGGGGW